MKTTNVLVGQCATCGETIRIAMDDKSKQEVIEAISKWETFSCPGHHVELSGPYPHHWPMDAWEVQSANVLDEAEFEAKLRADYKEVRDTQGMSGLITGFAAGFPLTNDGKCWNFTESPKGKRWYYTND